MSDSLIALAGAAGEALAGADFLGEDATRGGFGAVAQGRVVAALREVRSFFETSIKRLKARHGDEAELVLIVDSLDHMRGTWANADDVQASVEDLFAGHADKLCIPNVHVIYTVPTFLEVRYSNLGARYGAGRVPIFPAVKRRPEALRRVVACRGDVKRLFCEDEALLDRIIRASGGHLRDLLRLVAAVILGARALPVDERAVELALDNARTQMLPIPDEDARWLARIAESHVVPPGGGESVRTFERCVQREVLVGHASGRAGMDIHPPVKDLVMGQAGVLAGHERWMAAS